MSETTIAEYSPTTAALAELAQRFKGVVYDVTTTKGDSEARAARLELVKLRTTLEAKRKELKAPALERSRLIDDEAKRITSAIVALEKPIDEQIKAEEQRKEAARQAKIEQHLREMRESEDRRIAAERERIEAEQKVERERLAAERAAFEEEQRKAREERAEADRKAAADRAEADRVAREQRQAEEQRLAAERAKLEAAQEQERKRIAEERAAEERRIAAARANDERVRGAAHDLLHAARLALEEIHHPGYARSIGANVDEVLRAAIDKAIKP